jgi:hypothetical protein
VTEPVHTPDAAESALAARDAFHGASRRRADATTAAQQLIDNALVTEKAEKDAACAALAASIRRLGAEEVPVEDIVDLCAMPIDSVRVLLDRPSATAEPSPAGEAAMDEAMHSKTPPYQVAGPVSFAVDSRAGGGLEGDVKRTDRNGPQNLPAERRPSEHRRSEVPMAQPIVSGQPYQVVNVDDAAPSSLWDFTGPRTITLQSDTQTLLVMGTGVATEDYVRFYEKRPDGRDMRIWRIAHSQHEFRAVHDAMI